MVAIDADGREIADPAAARACRWRACRGPAASTGSPASPGAVETMRCVVVGKRRADRIRDRLAVELVAARCPPARSRSNFSGERVVPATSASPATSRAKGAAGIAGAEDEEALGSCGRSRLRAGAPVAARPFGAHLVVRFPRRMLGGQRVEARRPAAAATAPIRPRRAPAATDRRAARGKRPASAGIAGIAGGDQHVAQEAVAADALDRRARKQRAEAGIVERQQIARAAGCSKIVAGDELRLRRAAANLFHGQTARQSSQP